VGTQKADDPCSMGSSTTQLALYELIARLNTTLSSYARSTALRPPPRSTT
jgi:hypothetical protein